MSIDLHPRWNQGGNGSREQHNVELPHRKPDHAGIPQCLSEVIIDAMYHGM